MIEHLGTLIGYLGTLLGIGSTAYMFRRARRAEVRSREIDTADRMVDLVVKANEEIEKIRRKENERLCKSINRLELAIKKINTCEYRAACPVADSLSRYEAPESEFSGQRLRGDDRDADLAGHGRGGRGGSVDDPSTTRLR